MANASLVRKIGMGRSSAPRAEQQAEKQSDPKGRESGLKRFCLDPIDHIVGSGLRFVPRAFAGVAGLSIGFVPAVAAALPPPPAKRARGRPPMRPPFRPR